MRKPALWDGDLTGPPGEQGTIGPTSGFKTDFEFGEALGARMERIQESMQRELVSEMARESGIGAERQSKPLGAE